MVVVVVVVVGGPGGRGREGREGKGGGCGGVFECHTGVRREGWGEGDEGLVGEAGFDGCWC